MGEKLLKTEEVRAGRREKIEKSERDEFSLRREKRERSPRVSIDWGGWWQFFFFFTFKLPTPHTNMWSTNFPKFLSFLFIF